MILFVHGWGYDASFWEPLRAALGELPGVALDLGDFGAPDTDIPAGVSLLVGHSLGFGWLLRQASLQHLPLIGINAFPRFLEGDDYKPAVAQRLLDRMRWRAAIDPQGVLAEFWQRAGTHGPDREPDAAALAAGLDLLANLDERGSLARRDSALGLIAGTEDAIVPRAMSEMAFRHATIQWLPGGHALPRSHPGEVAAMIRATAGGAVA